MVRHLLAGDGPPELVILICEACESLRDVLALTSACRALHRIGRAHAVARLWSELDRDVLCLDEALVAVRVTELVADAERRGELPPLRVSPWEYSSSRRKPTIPELQAAVSLSQLVNLLATAIRRTNPFTRGVTFLRWLPDQPLVVRGREWRTRVHKAIYRVLICAAALAGAYNEPTFRARPRPALELVAGANRGELSERQLEFLEQFAVCSRNPPPEVEDAAFGPLASWLLQSILSDANGRAAMAKRFDESYGRARYCRHRPSCPVTAVDGGSHSDGHFVAWEVMQMLWAREHLGRSVDRRPPRRETDEKPTGAADGGGSGSVPAGRSMHAVFFGVFNTEEICRADLDSEGVPSVSARLAYVPARDAARYELEPAGHGDENMWIRPVTVWGTSVAALFAQIRRRSGRRPNGKPKPAKGDDTEAAGTHTAPLANKFFEYFLRRHLHLRLLPTVFDEPTDPSYLDFLGSLAIFAHDDVLGQEPYKGRNASVISDASFLDGTELLAKLG